LFVLYGCLQEEERKRERQRSKIAASSARLAELRARDAKTMAALQSMAAKYSA